VRDVRRRRLRAMNEHLLLTLTKMIAASSNILKVHLMMMPTVQSSPRCKAPHADDDRVPLAPHGATPYSVSVTMMTPMAQLGEAPHGPRPGQDEE
jgi:hypothetical protein